MRALWISLSVVVLGCGNLRPAAVPVAPEGDEVRYAAVIDAGSSGSRVYLYQWRPGRDGGLPWVEAAPYPRGPGEPAWEMKVEPGLSSFADDLPGIAASLEPLIDFAREKIGGSPRELAGYPIHLKATAGLRLLEPVEQEAILAATRAYLETTGFAVGSVEVISGRDEGVFGWVSVNYTLGLLGRGGLFPSVGALDLGGASTQITFLPLDHPREEAVAITLAGVPYRLYTRSYLGLGQDQALAQVGSASCYARGYPLPDGGVGAGDYAACKSAVRELLSASCERGPCSLMGVYQPPLYGEFFAFSAYWYAASFFELGQTLEPEVLEERGRAFCSLGWDEIREIHRDSLDDPYLPRHCFTAAFLVTLLNEGYGFPLDSREIKVPRQLQGNDIGWSLGALVLELAEDA